MTPIYEVTDANNIGAIILRGNTTLGAIGGVSNYRVFYAQMVSPVAYLKTNKRIVSGEGTLESPFVIDL